MNSLFGYSGSILYIDLLQKTTRVERPDQTWYRLFAGGGLMGTAILYHETQPLIDAFSPDNRLIFISSVIAGIEAPGLARFSVISKSPLSNGIAESRCEGPFGTYLKGSGFDAIVFSGKAEHPVYIIIESKSVHILPAEKIWGKTTAETTKIIEDIHGKEDIQVAVIGQAGENLVRYAGIVTNYSNQAMRMGTGAVMGSKNLKALVLKGKIMPAVYDSKGLEELKIIFQKKMLENKLSMWQKNPPGFAASADLSDYETAYIGYENYQSNLQVENSKYTRQAYMPYFAGDISCPGCPNDCIKLIVPEAESNTKSAGIHQEVTGSLGPNIGNGDIAVMLRANVLCNLYGIDPVSLGFALSFAMECNKNGILTSEQKKNRNLNFGDSGELLFLIEDIVFRKGLGDLLAEGVRIAANKIGGDADKYAMHVKGIEMVSFEPRSMTNLALGYATAPVGPRYDICEHDWDFDTISGWEHTLDNSRTLGIFKRVAMQELSNEKIRNYKVLNNLWSACDAMNLCIFASAPTRVWSLELIAKLIHVITGWKTSSYEFMKWGERRNHLMRLYNYREGLTAANDCLPARFFEERILNGRLKGVVLEKEQFKKMILFYYEMMGWDKNGLPLYATIVDNGLEQFYSPPLS